MSHAHHPSTVAELKPAEVQALLQNQQILLIDVREPVEYSAERIHGALLYPLSTFDPAFLPGDEPRRLVFHCAGGVRSLNAAQKRLAKGMSAAHMAGGLAAWKAAGLPTVKVDPATGQIIDAGLATKHAR